MGTQLTLTTDSREDGTVLLVASGEIDLSNVSAFSSALAHATQSGAAIVDLRGVDYLDSGGINALFTYADRIRIRTHSLLMPVLTVSGLVELVDIEQ
ncbi:STAS domain-containing protein [Amycolatopsis azurea]|uniref:Anti-anti-sigma factor n=1 Tax=Amycolatopsis azurea DSM 43854 TaxID=1238180 RepID=M2PGE7_9PSEU|nr:STAS domain-containing protein [Amycolatopsis azurea]EMD23418.1 Anti-sigma F factor antagonist (spoIIAA-2) protein [Amycolatopsis azurea DSM 43854]OOC04903.1 anti-anti-sigma factor [Amycolatopsis azurea DSM 43854]